MTRAAYIYRADNPMRLRPLLGGQDVLIEPVFNLGTTQPDVSSTGTYAPLTNYAGSFSPTPGTTYRDLRITGSMVDFASAGTYTFENCEFAPAFSTLTARGVLGGNITASANIVLNRCTIKPQVASNQLTGIYALNFTATRCDISNITDGFASYGTANLFGNYVHDLAYVAASYQSDGVTHNDGFQVFGGTNHVVRGNFFDMRPGPLSDRSAPASSSTGGVGQSIALTPTRAQITNMLIELNWFDYGFRGIGGAAPANAGGSILIQQNRFGNNIASFPVSGYGSARRPIIVDTTLTLTGLPSSGLGVTDTANGNVNYDGSPTTVYRQIP